jgi:intein/homing endonuclease
LKYTDFGCQKWTVPSPILESNRLVKAAFIRGFFDGDGSVDYVGKKIPRIRFGSSNFNGLKMLSKLLKSINLEHSLNGPYLQNNKLPLFELLLKTSSIKNFVSLIGSEHKNKNIEFQKIIAEAGYCAEVDKIYPQSHN